ncbi:hypothetical protein FRC05_007691 [Tulasnella sp. 425]|nr:hypothetical protein FRC05_007691 [Tulasnella sp. 425]
MATARVSFATPPSTDSGESSPASLAVTLEPVASSDEPTTAEVSELKAILDDTAHLVVARERLTVVGEALASNQWFETFLATLDEASQFPRSVTTIAKFIQVWKDLKHPNVLGLLGYTLKHENEIEQLISPYLINGNIREFLKRDTPVGVAQRLGFTMFGILKEGFRYASPEKLLDEAEIIASDVWSWGCVAFEIITNKRPFADREGDVQVLNSIIQRKAPGQPDILLSLVPNAPKPEYASTLRLLHSYLPLCWEYEPKKRPSISLLRRQVFMFSFEDDAGDSVVATLEELAHLLIPPERLYIVERSALGEGNYGEVVLGTLDEASSSPRDVAVKRLKAVGTRGERVRLAKRLARELNIWAKIKHPNVVELIGYYLDEKYEAPLLISALMTNGNVLDYIERYKPDIEQRLAFMKGITAGLACLHNFDPAICHADLKPANVLLDLHMNAVLCDFGLASFVSGPGGMSGLATTTTLKGTPRYMSPELLLETDCRHNLESDVWAWACTVFEVLTGRIPYAEITGDVQFYLAIDRKEPPGDVASLLPNDAEDCWDFDPQNRPTVRAILSHISNISPPTGNEASVNEDVVAGDTQARQGLSDLSSQRETSFHGNEYVASGGLEEGTKLVEGGAPVEEDDKTVTPVTSDWSSPKISTHLVITLFCAAALILSLSVNIFQFLQKVEPLPHHEASRLSYQERDL